MKINYGGGIKLSRRHILKKGDQWFSIGFKTADEDGWVDVDKQYWGKTVASADPNNLHMFRRNATKKIKEHNDDIISFKDENGKSISFKFDNIEKVYSGKPNTCMCGCAGKYFKSSSMISRVVKRFENFTGKIENLRDRIFSIITSPTRQYFIYLKKTYFQDLDMQQHFEND